MAIELIYETRELGEDGELEKVEKHVSTSQEEVKNIMPEEEKVGLHLEGETVLIPWSQVIELSIDLDPETVQKMEQEGQER